MRIVCFFFICQNAMCCIQGRIKKFQVMTSHVSSEESDLRKILPLGIDWADVVAALQELPMEELVRIKDPPHSNMFGQVCFSKLGRRWFVRRVAKAYKVVNSGEGERSRLPCLQQDHRRPFAPFPWPNSRKGNPCGAQTAHRSDQTPLGSNGPRYSCWRGGSHS